MEIHVRSKSNSFYGWKAKQTGTNENLLQEVQTWYTSFPFCLILQMFNFRPLISLQITIMNIKVQVNVST